MQFNQTPPPPERGSVPAMRERGESPGTYDMPADDAVSLLQAVATAGGYTRIANPRKITIQRTLGSDSKVILVDATAMALNKQKPIEILQDDVIVVGERWF